MSDNPQNNPGDAPADNPQDNPQGNNPADNPDPGDAPDLYRPEGIADHLIGENDQGTIDNILKAYNGARSELAKKQAVPEKLEDYDFTLPEDLAAKVMKPGEDGKDPVFEKMRGILHKAGVPAEKAIDIAVGFYEEVAAIADAQGGEGGEGPDLDWGYESFGGAEKAQPLIDANEAWIDGLKNQGVITEEDAADMASNLKIGVGLAWMDKLRIKLGGGEPIKADLSGGKSGKGLTKEQLDQRVADPRYRKGSKEFDPEFFAETTRLFEQFYNEDKAA